VRVASSDRQEHIGEEQVLRERKWIFDGYTLRCDRHPVNADKTVTEFKHVVSERNDDELSVLRTVLDIVGIDRNVPEVKCCVDLVHEVLVVQRCRFEDVKSEDESQRTEGLFAARNVRDVLLTLLRRHHRDGI